jgi:hypothetical protein
MNSRKKGERAIIGAHDEALFAKARDMGMVPYFVAEASHVDLGKENDVRFDRVLDELMDLEAIDECIPFQGKVPASGPGIALWKSCEEKNPGHVLPFTVKMSLDP